MQNWQKIRKVFFKVYFNLLSGGIMAGPETQAVAIHMPINTNQLKCPAFTVFL